MAKLIPDSTEDTFFHKVQQIVERASESLDDDRQRLLGQYFTSIPVARSMASLIDVSQPTISLLDAGAGVGVLSAACVYELCQRIHRPSRINVTCYEKDESLCHSLDLVLALCSDRCQHAGIEFSSHIFCADFLENYAADSEGFALRNACDLAVINPPYRKLSSRSEIGGKLRPVGIVATNYYTAFLQVCIHTLNEGGRLIAITPRSFCNGPYHERFRAIFTESMVFNSIHLFGSRDRVFAQHNVLQETMVFRATKTRVLPEKVEISSSIDAVSNSTSVAVAYGDILIPDDPHMFVRLPLFSGSGNYAPKDADYRCTLNQLNLEVSTGPLVDFRHKEDLRKGGGDHLIPLIYPHNIVGDKVQWPIHHYKKFDAVYPSEHSTKASVPIGHYVIVARMTSKDEARRVIAALLDAEDFDTQQICLENHVNFFHCAKAGLDKEIAKGLVAYLNSGFVERRLREFNGHTQVNAADLRSIRYPSSDELRHFGRQLLQAHDHASTDSVLNELGLQTADGRLMGL